MKNVYALFKYLPALAVLIASVEEAFGPKNGSNKKKAVIDAFTAILTQADPLIEAANPGYAQLIGDVVDFLVKQLNAYGDMSKPVPPVAIPPVKKPAPGH